MISILDIHFMNKIVFAGCNLINLAVLIAVTKHLILFQEQYNITDF